MASWLWQGVVIGIRGSVAVVSVWFGIRLALWVGLVLVAGGSVGQRLVVHLAGGRLGGILWVLLEVFLLPVRRRWVLPVQAEASSD